MDQRHQEYVEYYRARLRKYEGSPLYPRSRLAEQALFDAISTASSLEEFGERLRAGKLDLACAVARVRDVHAAWVEEYERREEVVRAGPHQEILAKLDATDFDNVNDLVTMVTEVETRWQLRVSMDEHLRSEFWGDWKILEDIEEDETAAVPERWQAERRERAAKELQKGAEHWREHTLPNARKFDPGWAPDWEALKELRHRRNFPVPQGVFERRIAEHKRYTGGE